MLGALRLALRSASANGCGGVMKAQRNPGGPTQEGRFVKVAKLSGSE